MAYLFILIGILPSLVWLAFFLREDRCPEPKKIILRAFIAGSLATLIAVIAEQSLQSRWFPRFGIELYAPIALIIFAVVEEFLKGIFAYISVRASRFFDEPVDAMIYFITAGLGFAAIENVAIAIDLKNFSAIFEVIGLRFVGATLLHAISSGLVGYWLATGIIRRKEGRGLVKGIIIASALHAVFNYLIIIFEKEIFYPISFLAIAALFLFWNFEKIKNRIKTISI